MARRIVDRLRDPVDYQGYTIHPWTSIGVTIFPDDDRDAEQVLKNASLGEALGLGVVGEGVESVEQQRFLCSRPLEAREMTLFLEGSAQGRCMDAPEDVLAIEPV